VPRYGCLRKAGRRVASGRFTGDAGRPGIVTFEARRVHLRPRRQVAHTPIPGLGAAAMQEGKATAADAATGSNALRRTPRCPAGEEGATSGAMKIIQAQKS
jgi:hypothetical protein